MLQQYEQAERGVRPGFFHRATARRAHGRAQRDGDIDPGMGLSGIARGHLAAGDEAARVERPMEQFGRP